MKRRLFFGSSVALAAALMVGSAAKASTLTVERVGSVAVVRGEVDEVIAFMYRFQDSLWKDWRSSPEVVAMYKKHDRLVRESGCIGVYVGCDQTRQAFASSGGNTLVSSQVS